MSLTAEVLAKFCASEFDVDYASALSAARKFMSSQPLEFSSKKAEKLYDELKTKINVEKLRATGKGGKLTTDDIRSAAGEETKRKAPSEFSHHSARELAEKEGLTPSDFPEEKRSGKPIESPLSSGCTKRITVADVRQMMIALGNTDETVALSLFTSPGVYKAAKDAGLSPSAFNVSGKISKADVTAAIQAKKMESAVNPFEVIEETETEMATVED